MSQTEQLADVLEFARPSQRPDVRLEALSLLTPFIDAPEYRSWLIKNALTVLTLAFSDQEHTELSDLATKLLINLSASGTESEMVAKVFTRVLEDTGDRVDNQSRMALNASLLINLTVDAPASLDKRWVLRILEWYLNGVENALGQVLVNISQLQLVRDVILDQSRPVLTHLLAYMDASPTTRLNILNVLRNCAFQEERHPILIEHALGKILEPLVGADLVDHEEFENMPESVRKVWNATKERETRTDITKAVLEVLEVFVRCDETRLTLKKAEVYVVLREYDTWEPCEENNLLVDDLVQWFIMDEKPELARR